MGRESAAVVCDDRGMLMEFSNQIAGAVAAAAPSVVQVSGRRAPASGVVYGPGVVVTTMRALGRENGLQVRQHDGRTSEAELAGWDPATGIAVLRAAAIDVPPLALSEASVRVGDVAIAIARSWSNAVTASAGIVAVIGGPLRTGRRRAIDQVYRTTAPMHEGFSGGAFMAASGGIIGLTTAASIRGFGVVIPAPIAWKAAGLVLEHGRMKRGYLGVAAQRVALSGSQREAGGREHALIVVNVAAGGPAAAAGVLVGDVILDAAGSPVDSPEQLVDLLLSKGVGDAVSLRVLRGTNVNDVRVTVGERPSQ
jgi:S1-C subfamily serine protease